MKSVNVTIKPDGTVSVEAMGFKGVGCTAATKEVEMALAGPAGVSDNDRRKKPDFYQSIAGQQKSVN